MQMKRPSCLEDLSTEIFFEIFDYFHALDIFVSFTSLNKRISSIIRSIHLRVQILSHHCRCQIDILSKYLTFYAHQVISIKIKDTIRDHSSVILGLFNGHKFVNLQACTFYTIGSVSQLWCDVIQQLKSLTKLKSMRILPDIDCSERETDKRLLCETVLTRMSPTIRSISFIQQFNPTKILSSSAMVTSNLTSLELCFSDPRNVVSLSSIFLVLRTYRLLRRLRVVIVHETIQNDNQRVPSTTSWNNDNLPISPYLVFFDLYTQDIDDQHLFICILRCMPNLHRFIFATLADDRTTPNAVSLLNGHTWQELLSTHLVHLNRFDLLLDIDIYYSTIDLDAIVRSFKSFVTQYDSWHFIVDRWHYYPKAPCEHVRLRTQKYPNKWKYKENLKTSIICGTFETRSTIKANGKGAMHSRETELNVFIKRKTRMPHRLLPSPPFQHVKNLLINFAPSARSLLWNYLLKLNCMHRIHGDDSARQCVAGLSCLVQLSNITGVEFRPTNGLFWLPAIEQILLACSKLTKLVIGTPLLLSPMFLNNSSLGPALSRLKTLVTVVDGVYFPLKCAPKLVQRFPSLVNIELAVYSSDACLPLVDVFLNGSAKLAYLKINFSLGSLLNSPCSLDYVIQKRRQSFGIDLSNKNNVTIKICEQALQIWLA